VRSLRGVLWSLLSLGLVVSSAAAAAPSMDSLLPRSTVGFISATSYPQLTRQWNKTQIGALMATPVMRPFEDDLHEQMQNQWQDVADRLGIHLDDLRGVPSGEASLALIKTQLGNNNIAATTALLMDVTGNGANAKKLLATAIKNLNARGAAQFVQTVKGVRVYVFNVPPAAGAPAAAVPVAAVPAPAAPAASTTMVYFNAKDVFCACDDLDVTKNILDRLVDGGAAGSLAKVASFQEVMTRCANDAPPKYVPQVRWFIAPLGYAEATRAATPVEKRRRGKTIIEIMRNQGYSAFQGVGGYLDLASDGYQIIHRTAIFAPKPWVESMKMFVFPAGKDFTPQPWVSRDVATYFTAYVDVLNVFDNFGPLYNEVLNTKEDIWKKTLYDLEHDPDGPQINIRKDLIQNLGQRVTMVAGYQLPITTTSERLLWAIEVKNPAAVANAIEKCVNNDNTIKKRLIGGQVIWEIVEEGDGDMAPPTIELPGGLGSKKDGKTKPDGDEEDKEGHFLPHGAFTVAQGQLFISSHIDFLVKTLKSIPPVAQLATQKEFLKVWNITFNDLGIKQQSARSFSWTDRAVEPTYELIRQGKMPQSESLLGRTLNSLAGAGKKGVPRHQRINGAKLPDFNKVVAPALGPATASMTAERDGWFVKGVLVTK
jgi:hypothetical protein